MNKWKDFLDSLDSTGGHIFILLALVVGLVAAALFTATDWLLRLVDMVVAAFLTALVGKARNGLANGGPQA